MDRVTGIRYVSADLRTTRHVANHCRALLAHPAARNRRRNYARLCALLFHAVVLLLGRKSAIPSFTLAGILCRTGGARNALPAAPLLCGSIHHPAGALLLEHVACGAPEQRHPFALPSTRWRCVCDAAGRVAQRNH